jgi:hypothetical protein
MSKKKKEFLAFFSPLEIDASSVLSPPMTDYSHSGIKAKETRRER